MVKGLVVLHSKYKPRIILLFCVDIVHVVILNTVVLLLSLKGGV